MKISLEEVYRRINDSGIENIVITSHAHPDGDSIASQLALYYFLKHLGKNVYIYNNDYVPHQYKFLPGTELIRQKFDRSFNPQMLIIVDVVPWERLGKVVDLKSYNLPIIVLDHHIYDTPIEEVNYINKRKAATAQIIYDMFKIADIPISVDAAVNLYTGILTDTGRFRFNNTDADVFKMAADLVGNGVKPESLTRKIYFNRPNRYIKNLAKVLNSIEVYQEKRTLFCYFTIDMNDGKPITMEDSEDIIEVINTLSDIDLYVFFKEYKKNEIKLSFRSRSNLDARSIAVSLGGGGHRQAAGAKVSGTVFEVKQKLLSLLNII